MADPSQVQAFIEANGIDPTTLDEQKLALIANLLDVGSDPDTILAALGVFRQGGDRPGFFGETDPNAFDRAGGFLSDLFGTGPRGGPRVPEVPEAPQAGFTAPQADSISRGTAPAREFGTRPGDFDPDFRAARPVRSPGLTPFDMAVLMLDEQFPGGIFGVRELGDGTIEVSFSNGNSEVFELAEDGGLFPLADDDPRRSGGGGGRGGGGSAVSRRQFAGTDPRTGRAIIFDPVTGTTSLGEQIGFVGIDPEREFALDQSAEARQRAQTVRDITTNGRNFLAAAFLANRGELPLGLPAAATVDQARLINSLGAGETAPAAGFAPTSAAGRTPTRADINAGFEAGGGDRFATAPATVPSPAPTGNAGLAATGFTGGPITQEELAALGAQTLEGTRVGSVLRGEAVNEDQRFRNFAVPTPDALSTLSEDELGALDTQLQNDPNLLLSLEEVRQRQRRGFSAPARRAPGSVRQV